VHAEAEGAMLILQRLAVQLNHPQRGRISVCAQDLAGKNYTLTTLAAQ
jgi:hypothetical protein